MISNLEFHHVGSGNIPGGIGKGLAEAMAELSQSGTVSRRTGPHDQIVGKSDPIPE